MTPISRLLDQDSVKVDVNAIDRKYEQTPLLYACRRAHSEATLELLKHGAWSNKADNNGNFPLFAATESEDIDTVQALCEHPQVHLNQKSGSSLTALMLATHRRNVEIIKVILDKRDTDVKSKDEQGNTALCLATMHGFEDVVGLLLRREGINVNLSNEVGMTALTIAASIRSNNNDVAAKICGQLLRRGADASIKNFVRRRDRLTKSCRCSKCVCC